MPGFVEPNFESCNRQDYNGMSETTRTVLGHVIRGEYDRVSSGASLRWLVEHNMIERAGPNGRYGATELGVRAYYECPHCGAIGWCQHKD